MQKAAPPRVGLFITCLVDLFRPSVGFAAVRLLEEAGCSVEVPPAQTCCGQPAYNSGARSDAKDIARNVIMALQRYDYVVAPSGSCAGMLKKHYPLLFAGDAGMEEKAQNFAAKVYELLAFLTDVMGVKEVKAEYAGEATYHDSCSSLREMGVRGQPRQLLGSVKGLKLKEMEDWEVCCGFGGAFSVKYPEISNVMVTGKTAKVTETGAKLLLGGDLGCLMNMAGKLARDGRPVSVRHVAEVLAGMTGEPAIGEAKQ